MARLEDYGALQTFSVTHDAAVTRDVCQHPSGSNIEKDIGALHGHLICAALHSPSQARLLPT